MAFIKIYNSSVGNATGNWWILGLGLEIVIADHLRGLGPLIQNPGKEI